MEYVIQNKQFGTFWELHENLEWEGSAYFYRVYEEKAVHVCCLVFVVYEWQNWHYDPYPKGIHLLDLGKANCLSESQL